MDQLSLVDRTEQGHGWSLQLRSEELLRHKEFQAAQVEAAKVHGVNTHEIGVGIYSVVEFETHDYSLILKVARHVETRMFLGLLFA